MSPDGAPAPFPCPWQVKMAYVNFVNHCYVDTEVEMKEIYTSNHIWTLFENFTLDMAQVHGEGWEGGAQQWWLGWGQHGVTKAPLKPSAGHGYTHGTSYSCHTQGWGEWSGLSGVTTGAVSPAVSLSSVWSQQPLGRHELSLVPSAPSLSSQMCKKREKRLPDATLEKYVLTVVLDTINAFFSSPFSENSTSLQVTRDGQSDRTPPKTRFGCMC